ncbi:1-deoxy-D-xylulose-5-phosphate synthase [Fusobacterium necrophorum subsp. necrophorum]|nr:1-deoxy-D-xylulose-5-phosphate synthase [Fusobacterium necrophorum subsp. necrophorum]
MELTLALHHVFDFSQDKILFDVGHQSYVHKLVTDREQEFSTLRTRGGVGPFSDPSESSWDHFISGHAGTALAAAVGIAKAYPEKQIVVIVGDASIANGHSMEALNYIGGEKIENILVILNDNGMSIGRNVGSLSKFLRKVMLSSHYLSLRNEIRAFVDKIQARAIKDTLERMEISVKNFCFQVVWRKILDIFF